MVLVPDQNKLELAIRIFKKKGQKEGLIKEARRRKEYEKPSIRKRRKEEESVARVKRKRRQGNR